MPKDSLVSLKPIFSFLGLSIIPRLRVESAEIQRDNIQYALDLHNERRQAEINASHRS
jgi:hypothetical protein